MKRHFHTANITNSPHLKKGSFLIEMTVAMTLLVAIAMILLTGTLDMLAPRKWTIYQNYSDAYLTYEEAYSKRIPFDDLISATSPWKTAVQQEDVIMGKDYNGQNVTGTIQRILEAGPDNDNALNTNPAEMETYILYSVLTYKIGDKDYVKTRTSVRTR